MTKENGLGAGLFLDGYDLSGDSREVGNISKALTELPQTGIDKYAMERAAGQLDATLEWVSFFNPTNAHIALTAMPRTDRVASYMHKQNVLGTPVANIVCKQVDLNTTRGDKGDFTSKVKAVANAWWLDWGQSLTTGQRTDVAATNGTGVDFGDPAPLAYTFGAQFYLQVFAFTGTDVTIKVQESSDNGTDPWADVVGGTFTVVTAAHTSEQKVTTRALAVDRYLRVVTTGTFTSVKFTVAAVVNNTSMVI